MGRNFNTTTAGGSFDAKTIEAVWNKATTVAGSTLRRDKCSALISREKYGKTEQYGWEIDHMKPVAKGGTDELGNLQPLRWENNRHKSDNYPDWQCKLKS